MNMILYRLASALHHAGRYFRGLLLLGALVLTGLGVSACTRAADTPGAETASPAADGSASHVPDPAHSSQNSLDWPGTYEGVVPCADCPGIRTTLTLLANGTYILERQYLDRGAGTDRDTGTDRLQGAFEWTPDGGTIRLTGTHGGVHLYRVGENALFQLDQEGRRIQGPLAHAYTLTRK